MWSALKCDEEYRASSILYTVLIAQEFRKIADTDKADDEDTLRAIVKKIADRLEASHRVKNPVNSEEDLNRLGEENTEKLIKKFRHLEDIAERAKASNSKIEASVIWSEAFDHFFPIPSEDTLASANALVPYTVIPLVSVTAVSKKNPNLEFSGINRIGPLPRDCSVYFEIQNTESIPERASLEWFVRNAGSEAEGVNDLGHRAGDGLSARENTAYAGIHFMDLIIRLGRRVIGFRRIPVQIQNIVAPVRNPPRPAYRQLVR